MIPSPLAPAADPDPTRRVFSWFPTGPIDLPPANYQAVEFDDYTINFYYISLLISHQEITPRARARKHGQQIQPVRSESERAHQREHPCVQQQREAP